MRNKYKRLLQDVDKDNDFWPSFTDMLSTILLVVLLIFMAVILNKHLELVEAQEEVETNEAKIEEQRQTIKNILGVKQEIIKDLLIEFEETDLMIEIDQETGAIKFQDDLLFEKRKSIIQPKFKDRLQEFIPKYFTILFGKYSEHISEIVVEGHTDDDGSFNSNLVLSQERAFSVVQYMLSDEFGEFPYKEIVRDKITANGRSESILKFKEGSNEVDQEKSRRVEFKFRLYTDSEWEQILDEIDQVE